MCIKVLDVLRVPIQPGFLGCIVLEQVPELLCHFCVRVVHSVEASPSVPDKRIHLHDEGVDLVVYV